MEECPLCKSEANIFSKTKDYIYFCCKICRGIFMGKDFLPDIAEEKHRYELHNNDVNDPQYQEFVSPIVNAVLTQHKKDEVGIDFGAGTGPVISKILTDNHFNIKQYDPFFHNHPELLNKKYDYIVCCEVIEHFHKPIKEFALLKSILNEGGNLFCMTNIYTPDIDFVSWYYRNDNTHVFFYTNETLHFICKKFGFKKVIVSKDLITFKN